MEPGMETFNLVNTLKIAVRKEVGAAWNRGEVSLSEIERVLRELADEARQWQGHKKAK